MGTIVTKTRKSGSVSYTAQIVRKKGSAIVHRESKTFDKKREAEAWLRWREAELDKPGALDQVKSKSVNLASAIDTYLAAKRDIGRTKAQCLSTIKSFAISSVECGKITSADISDFARQLADGGRKPQTVGNYISHLAAIFRDAKPLWGIPLDYAVMKDAQAALTRFQTISKSEARERRPTIDELEAIMQHFADRSARAPRSAPMHAITAFAIFSTRRQDEIARIEWRDLDEKHSRILVRDMKHPGQKKGNDVWCELPSEALRIIKAMPKTSERIFPFGTDAISASFTRACQFLQIADLHFHDMRHEGISRLFEMGRTIPLAASVSGHRSWNSLKRYTEIRQRGDKFENWHWLDKICGPVQQKEIS